ncbi:MAG: hypothetical protein ACLQF0_06750 [Dissulfurispiraceae bacterium]
MICHTGFYFEETDNQTTAVFQLAEEKDFLSCELIEYTGERETTKAEAGARLAHVKQLVIADLNTRYPSRNITDVTIEGEE